MANQNLLRKITRKLWEGDPKTLWALAFILTFIPLIIPFSLPIPVMFHTKDLLNEINKLKPGDIMLRGVEASSMAGYYWPYRTDFAAMNKYLASRHIRMIFVAVEESYCIQIIEGMIRDARLEEDYGYKYGTDYVVLPFLPATEVGMASLAADFHATAPYDQYGNPINSLPLMQQVKTLKDVNLVMIDMDTFTVALMAVRQWAIKFGVRTIGYKLGYATYSPYYGTSIFGVQEAGTGFAEFETLVGIPGEQMIRTTIGNVVHFAGLLFVLVPIYQNIREYMEERAKFEVKKV